MSIKDKTLTWEKVAGGVDDLPTVARDLLSFFPQGKIFAFYGKMGSGKTTFIKSLCEVLEVEDPVSSPTFAIVNEYKSKEQTVYHFDFYRIENLYEAIDMGAEEYFYSGAYCFIEWPEKIENLLPGETVKIQIETLDENKRVFRALNEKIRN